MVQVRPDPLNGKPLTREMLTPELMDAVFGTAEEMAARTKVFKRNTCLAEQAGAAEYPGQYVAVVDGRVVAHSPSCDEIIQQLTRLGFIGREGLAVSCPPPGHQ
ncbi:MAG: DUF5678 domain-containing protein [Dehalococcoidia bacterium]